MDQKYVPNLDDLVLRAADAERCVYRWCTVEGRGSLSARTLASVYASIHLDHTRLLRFADLRVLDDKRLEWAVTLIYAYVAGAIQVPWARAVALVALYDLYSDSD